MSYITTVSPDDAGAEVAALYEGDLESQGYIANYSRVFSLRPQAAAARCFFAKVLDALGVEPHAEPLGLDPVLVRALAPARRSQGSAA